MRIVVHEPTVEAPEEASAVATAVLAALVTELRVLSDGGLSAGRLSRRRRPAAGSRGLIDAADRPD